MGLDDEAAAVGVDQRVTLEPVDLLARIVTARAAGLGGLDALAVDDRGRGVGVAPDPLAICHHKRVAPTGSAARPRSWHRSRRQSAASFRMPCSPRWCASR